MDRLTQKTIDEYIDRDRELKSSGPTLILSKEQLEKLRRAGLLPTAEKYECGWGQPFKTLAHPPQENKE